MHIIFVDGRMASTSSSAMSIWIGSFADADEVPPPIALALRVEPPMSRSESGLTSCPSSRSSSSSEGYIVNVRFINMDSRTYLDVVDRCAGFAFALVELHTFYIRLHILIFGIHRLYRQLSRVTGSKTQENASSRCSSSCPTQTPRFRLRSPLPFLLP